MIKYNLSGMVFGHLTVETLHAIDSHGRSIWKCRCVCGNYKNIPSPSLRLGKSKSCGCKKHEMIRATTVRDLSGQRFSKLVVTELSHFRAGYAYWKVRCDCGKCKTVRADSLTGGNTQSCGCLQVNSAKSRSGELNNMWRGGKSIFYPPEWDNDLREYIRNRDDRTCKFPGCEYDDTIQNNPKLHVHHIDGDKYNCKEYNLISLCCSHHMSVEKTSPESWQSYFYSITGDYEYERD